VIKYAEIVRRRLDRLAPRVEEAKALVKEVERRKDASEMDELSAHAESVSAEVVVSMFNTLEQLYAKSVENKDSYTIGCLFQAADIMRASLDNKLLEAGDYSGDEASRTKEAERKIGSGLNLYGRILRTLDNTQDGFNIPVPPFPVGPTVH
jgi:hypothetical protein